MADLPVVDPLSMKPVRDRKYLAFLRSEGVCDPCGYPGLTWMTTDPAHGPVNGMGSKGSDLEAIPLCRLHHQEQHAIGWKAFCAKYKLDRKELVGYWNRAYLSSGLTAVKESTGSVTSRL